MGVLHAPSLLAAGGRRLLTVSARRGSDVMPGAQGVRWWAGLRADGRGFAQVGLPPSVRRRSGEGRASHNSVLSGVALADMLYQVEEVPPVPIFLRVLIALGCGILSNAFFCVC